MSKRRDELKTRGARKVAPPSARSKAQPGPGLRKGNSSSHENRDKDTNYSRTNSTVRRLKMYSAKPDREAMKKRPEKPVVMIEPGRKWFNNTRTVSQDKLTQFRQALEQRNSDPRSILLKRTKLPVSLFDHSNETSKKRAANLLTIEPYEEVFSANKRRKRPRLEETDLTAMAASAAQKSENYVEDKDRDYVNLDAVKEGIVPIEAVMLKGTSKRIWNELYKVVDSADIIVQVLDARDPLGTRCKYLETHIKKDRPFKHIILLLNKCDLIPTHITDEWVKILGREFPTVAFKASIQHPFGKKAVIGLLRQFAEHMKNRKHVSVGFVGYPNVGKSSVINTLKSKKVCTTAPIPGETKVWQYIALTSKVYLIDCPGIVASSNNKDDFGKVLKGVVRAEKLDCPEDYIGAIIDLVTKAKINNHYKIPKDQQDWKDPEDFLEILCHLSGRLKKGGQPDLGISARRVIYDFQRGKLPYFIPPPRAGAQVVEPSAAAITSADIHTPQLEEPSPLVEQIPE